MRTGLLPIIIALETATVRLDEWVEKHCSDTTSLDLDPVDDEKACIRNSARLIRDQLVLATGKTRKLRERVQQYWVKNE